MSSNKSLSLRIACDGESASGKSLASKLIGRKLGLFVLNSGIIYRYASFLIIKHKPRKTIPFIRKKFKNLNKLRVQTRNLRHFFANSALQQVEVMGGISQ